MSRSIQQLPNNSGTTSVTEVYTSTGFSAGDPVYFQNGDYKNPANLTAPSSVGFSFANSSPYNPYGEGGSFFPAFSYAQMQTAGISGGSVRRFAAVLTNGNIVQVWTNHANSTVNTQDPYFRVISPSGTVVVSPTVISTTFSLDYTAISVVALTGGGFAVGWINNAGGTANSVNYAIYSNTGSVVTSATQDTSFSTGGSGAVPIEMTSLANGGFAIAIKNASATIFIRAYSSTGVGAYSTINSGFATNSANTSFGFVSRSDSSVCFIDYSNGTTLYYSIYSSTGTVIVSLASISITSTTIQSGADASVLSDGTTIVFAYYVSVSGTPVPNLRFLPTGNVLGSQIVGIPTANVYAQHTSGYGGYYISVLGITGSNVMLFFTDAFGNMQYAFYDASGVCISGSNSTGAIPRQMPGGYASIGSRITLLESSGSVFAYWNYATHSQVPVQQICAKISTSTYLVIPVLSVSGNPYLVTGQPTGALSMAGVNPNGPAYVSTASSSTVVTNTPTTITGPVQIASDSVDSIASCSLSNGGFVIVTRLTTGRTVTARVYSSVSALVSTIAVSTSSSSSSVVYGVKVAALSGGGFVVMYSASTATTAYTLQVYSSSYELTGSTTFTVTQPYALQYNFDMCGLLNNNFAIVFSNDGSNGAVRVYSSALSNIYSYGFSGTPQGMAIAGNSWGGFAISYYTGTGNFRSFVPTGTSTWSTGSAFTFSQDVYVQNPQMVSTSGMYVITGSRSSVTAYGMMTDAGGSAINATGASATWPWGSSNNPTSYPMMGIGLTGNGMVVFATSYDSGSLGIGNISPQVTWSAGQQIPYQQSGTSNLGTMFSNSAYNITSNGPLLNGMPRVTPLVGNNCLITFRTNAATYPAYIIVNGNSYSSVYSIIAGTTPSATVPVVPATTSGVISGTFAGVAVTSATAGSTGQLATNGQALLSASYTSTATGAFDSTGGAVTGLKGTFNGRSVNLQGNS